MLGDLPRLTRPQLDRLVKVGQNEGHLSALACRQPRTTDALIALNLLERYRWRTMEWVRLTLFGARVLAGLPGDEFDRFRKMVKEAVYADRS